jgi:chromosome segregation ATPase
MTSEIAALQSDLSIKRKTIADLTSENSSLLSKAQSSSADSFSLSTQITVLNLKWKNLNVELEESETKRKNLKDDIQELNDRIISFEEEVYESKNIQLDLLEQLREMENTNE